MKKCILIIFTLLLSQFLFAQVDTINYDIEVKEVQIMPSFPGGIKTWQRYLERNQDKDLAKKYIQLNDGDSIAKQTVIISFLVDKEGLLSEVTVTNPEEVHSEVAKATIKLFVKGPKWMPAQLHGRNVIYRHKMPVTWFVRRTN